AELILRKLSSKGLIKYIPGDREFEIIDYSKLDSKLLEALRKIKESVLEKYGSTGVQNLLNYVVFDVLNQIVVYPVRDPNRLSDKNGNVLPDAYIIPRGTRLREFAYLIHSELGERFLYGIDVRSNTKLKADYVLQNNDVISIVTS
ncbi:MAG: TGS domain-containing protein, partial [Candidatus Geothermarchaeota archaeon]